MKYIVFGLFSVKYTVSQEGLTNYHTNKGCTFSSYL